LTSLRQHIEDLDPQAWTALTRRAAIDAVAAAERRGMQAPAETVAVSTMTERELLEHRQRSGPARKRPSPMMQLVEADHLRAAAEGQARDAVQDKRDAQAAAAVARAEADESARAATAARERSRTVASDLAAAQQTIQQLRAELDQVRADTAAQIAAAQAQVRAADARAEQRTAERTSERAASEDAVQQLRAELDQVRADTAAQIAAAQAQVRAADARAEQRTAERTSERAAAEQIVQQLRAELDQVRADAAAEIAAARGRASGEISAARQAADAEVACAQAQADRARREAQAAMARAAQPRLLAIPIPPLEVRAHSRPIENALTALHQIDYVLEVSMAEEVDSTAPVDVELVRSLLWTVQEQAKDLPDQLSDLPAWYATASQAEAAAGYAEAAARAYGAFVQRIDTATEWLARRDPSPDAELVEAVNAMLADPWVQHMAQPAP
jgi:hypothetical protein